MEQAEALIGCLKMMTGNIPWDFQHAKVLSALVAR